jgi:uncharacterized protein (DUF983 family)
MTDISMTLSADPETGERPFWPAVRRGLMCRCPACGAGPMLKAYLKVRDHCPVCSEALYHHRADDGPAYLTILIVGHLLAPLIYFVYVTFRPEPLVMATTFCLLTGTLALFLLPRMKGALVALQWAKRMHGFAPQGPNADHGDA